MAEEKEISFEVPQQHIELLDELVNMGAFPNRSEAFKAGLRIIFKMHNVEFVEKESES